MRDIIYRSTISQALGRNFEFFSIVSSLQRLSDWGPDYIKMQSSIYMAPGVSIPYEYSAPLQRVSIAEISEAIVDAQRRILGTSIPGTLMDIVGNVVNIFPFMAAETREEYCICMNIALHALVKNMFIDEMYAPNDRTQLYNAILDNVHVIDERLQHMDSESIDVVGMYEQFVIGEEVRLPHVKLWSVLRHDDVMRFITLRDLEEYTFVRAKDRSSLWKPYDERGWKPYIPA
jgi:hypothetical protein